MFLHALATAVPPASFTQSDCWDIVQASGVRSRLHRRSMLTLHSILRSDSGIGTRHFAMPDISRVFDRTADELNDGFRTQAPRLAGRALSAALDRAGLRPADLDALLICTCTGYLCPGLTSYVAEELGIAGSAVLHDVVGLGCGAAIPMMRSAGHILAADPGARVACVAVEVCSAAFYLDDDPGVIISACLFSDGAAATVWRSSPGPTGARAFDFRSLHLPAERDKLRFEQRGGKLRNLLDRSVPQLAASAVGSLWAGRGERPVARVVSHPGGRDVLEAIAPVVAPHSLEASFRTLRSHGNMSSPSVLFALEEALAGGPPNGSGDFWLVSFGAGFSAHSCRLGS
ncbi:MAG TPA: 3-oxoacyl-[acyl-carrier-protein] synthase III C-terminal domain-containing protein [Opitutaceae bacterium]|jgi:alkylresorcinol/alkylpyrone synthase